jgi:CRISPR-associated protein Cas1
MVVTGENEEHRIPIEDLYSVVIDNQQTLLSTAVLTRLTASGAHVLICGEKHLPDAVILPTTLHYKPLTVMRSQIALPCDIKDRLWEAIVRQKIENQAKVIELCGGRRERAARLRELATEVADADAGNREGIAARMFFHELYGIEFVRFYDDAINAALNYGYTVIRSAVAKTLTAYGYNCVLGLHHINEANPFNLADDVMEPLRPLVDLWVSDHREELVDELTRQHKNELAALVNAVVLWDGKKMRLRNAVDRYVSSLTSAVSRLSPKLLKIPAMIRTDAYNETDD